MGLSPALAPNEFLSRQMPTSGLHVLGKGVRHFKLQSSPGNVAPHGTRVSGEDRSLKSQTPTIVAVTRRSTDAGSVEAIVYCLWVVTQNTYR